MNDGLDRIVAVLVDSGQLKELPRRHHLFFGKRMMQIMEPAGVVPKLDQNVAVSAMADLGPERFERGTRGFFDPELEAQAEPRPMIQIKCGLAMNAGDQVKGLIFIGSA